MRRSPTGLDVVFADEYASGCSPMEENMLFEVSNVIIE